MAILPSANYNYTIKNDVYSIENTSEFPITLTLIKVDCDSTKIIKTITIPVATKTDVFDKNLDGLYQIRLSNYLGDIDVITQKYYLNLIEDIIDKTEEVLCGCKGCGDCTDCNSCKNQSDLITEMLSYSYLNAPIYDSYLSNLIKDINCQVNEDLYCYELNELINGKGTLDPLLLKIIGVHYLSFYNTDLALAITNDEKLYIQNKYKANKILKCIARLGITVPGGATPPTVGKVFFWQGNGIDETIDNITPLMSQAYLDTKSSDTFQHFKEGLQIHFTQVGRYVLYMEGVTEINSISIMDGTSADISFLFDFVVIPQLHGVLAVSKNFYIPSVQFLKYNVIPQ